LWNDAAGRNAAVAVMREVCRAANADLAARGSAASLDEEAVVARLSAVTDDMAEVNYVPSTTKDFREGRRMEVEAIFGEPLRRALANGVATPRLEALAALLRVANDRVAPS
jgi:2-dehydropantoate 2-reductase